MDDKSPTKENDLYAIFVPNSPQPTVFRELKEVRKFLDSPLGKKEGTRFKKCAGEDELRSFIAAEAKKEEESPKQSASTSAEPTSPYRSLPTARFTEFRRTIEQRNDEKFEALIEENPRFFLNTNTDSPAIVQEGYRFNTLHVACRTSNVAVVKRCFELARDLEWLTHVYGTDRGVEERSEFLINSLLNTPDLIENNTPLHYACKFGQPEIVRFLLTFPNLKRYPRNKYNEKPMDMLCRGFRGPSEEKERRAAEIKAIFRRGLSPARHTPSHAMGAGGDAAPSSPLSHLAGHPPSTPRSSLSATSPAGGGRVKTFSRTTVTTTVRSSSVEHAKRFFGAFFSAAAEAILTAPMTSTSDILSEDLKSGRQAKKQSETKAGQAESKADETKADVGEKVEETETKANQTEKKASPVETKADEKEIEEAETTEAAETEDNQVETKAEEVRTKKAAPQTPRSPMTSEVSMIADELRDKLLLNTPPPHLNTTMLKPASPIGEDESDEKYSSEDDDSAYHDASDLPPQLPDDEAEDETGASEADVDDGTAESMKDEPNRLTQSTELPQWSCTIL